MELVIAALSGILLALFFFGGLWWTVRQVTEEAKSAGWLLGSFVARSTVVLVGFYLVGSWSWQALAVAAATFVMMRFVATRYLGLEKRSESVLEGS